VVGSGRRLGYALLGSRFDYLLHTRPLEWPIMAAHTAVGYLLAVGLGGAGNGEFLNSALLGTVLWVCCLNGGTLALNSAYDRDEGDIAYLRRPPRPPRHLAGFALGLMLLGFAGAFFLPGAYRAAYAICLGMSVLYSVPPFRLKAVPGADWIINMAGFGTLTPYAGWTSTGLPLDPARELVLLAFCPLFAALYPLTQIYQFEEDASRGDRTLARILGVKISLLVSCGGVVLAFALFAIAGLKAGWETLSVARWTGLVLAAVAWAAVLLPWLVRHRSMQAPDHQRGMYYALSAWALTDIVIVFAWAA
jgi:lycopene elongase/hydratase (dihydrobisanhydrobacterioruberin-forming)